MQRTTLPENVHWVSDLNFEWVGNSSATFNFRSEPNTYFTHISARLHYFSTTGAPSAWLTNTGILHLESPDLTPTGPIFINSIRRTAIASEPVISTVGPFPIHAMEPTIYCITSNPARLIGSIQFNVLDGSGNSAPVVATDGFCVKISLYICGKNKVYT